MPDIEFRLVATDEATPVIDRARKKMDEFNRTSSPAGGAQRPPLPPQPNRQPQLPPYQWTKPQAGGGGMLGGGKIGAGAGIAIIAQAAVQLLEKMYKVLLEASPYLESITQQFKTATNIYLRPMGDALARMLQPSSEAALELAEQRSELFAKMEQDYGPVATILATVASALADAWMALFEFQWGVTNALSKVIMWPIDKLGEMLGVDLPGSLNELLEEMFGIKGGFSGVKDYLFTELPNQLAESGEGFKRWFTEGAAGIGQSVGEFGNNLKTTLSNGIAAIWSTLSTFGNDLKDRVMSGLSNIGTALSGLGSWFYGSFTGALSGAWTTLSTVGNTLYESITNALKNIGSEAYKAFHNSIGSMLNGIANIELPLVGKPFKGLFGTIPMLASGGIVTRPTLAMIGEAGPEAVIPLGKAGGFGGQQTVININAPIYGVEDLERSIIDVMSREQIGYSGYR